jgi:hypothetical protein
LQQFIVRSGAGDVFSFPSFFASMRILYIDKEQNILKANPKKLTCKLFSVHPRPVFYPQRFFEILSLLKSQGVVESENFFLHINHSFYVFRGKY